MTSLFIYIFGKTYFLYERIYADKEHPQYFSASIVALLTTLSIAVLIDLIIYPIDPSLITAFYGFYKYMAVGMLLLSWWIFHPKRRYLKIVERYKQIGDKRKKLLGFLSIAYVLILLFIFFKMSDLVRTYNLGYTN